MTRAVYCSQPAVALFAGYLASGEFQRQGFLQQGRAAGLRRFGQLSQGNARSQGLAQPCVVLAMRNEIAPAAGLGSLE